MFPWPSVLLQICPSNVAVSQMSVCRLLTPRSLLLHLVEQRRYTLAQGPLAVFAYEVLVRRILDDFLRHLSAFALPFSVAGESLVFGVMATAWVKPHRNRAHCALLVVECSLGTVSCFARITPGMVMCTHEGQVSWAVTTGDVSCGTEAVERLFPWTPSVNGVCDFVVLTIQWEQQQFMNACL